MKEIVFTTPMVRAILDGRKTQTRRLVKPQPYCIAHPQPIGEKWHVAYSSEAWGIYDTYAEMFDEYRRLIKCPYGKVGDRLWVREEWGAKWEGSEKWVENAGSNQDGSQPIAYRASGDTAFRDFWKPSSSMPRWASRITLEIVAVRIERLQDISEADALAEGVQEFTKHKYPHSPELGKNYAVELSQCGGSNATDFSTARDAFAELWDSIYRKKDGAEWESNPFVWRIEFKRLETAAKV